MLPPVLVGLWVTGLGEGFTVADHVSPCDGHMTLLQEYLEYQQWQKSVQEETSKVGGVLVGVGGVLDNHKSV